MRFSLFVCFTTLSVGSIFLGLVVLNVFFGAANAVGIERSGGWGFTGTRSVMVGTMNECLLLESGRDACYARLCEYEAGYLCAEEVLDVAVEAAGPERAMGVLHDIMASPLFAITTDGHLLSHIIGRATSRILGSTGENFIRCPHDFNDGCYHGFFEDMLVKVDDPVAVTVEICEGMPAATTSDKERSYCYHGAGHVFLMNESHELQPAIEHCSAVPDRWVDTCLSGVFMENAWPTRGWEKKKLNFREDDPLYPCNSLDERFQHTCYMEHYSYLMHEHSTSFDELVEICMTAGARAGDCLNGIGLMLQNSQRTDVMAKSLGIADKPYMEKIIFICNRFPDGHKDSCYMPLVGALLNFDYPAMNRVVTFCDGIEEDHRFACFRRAGSYLNHLGSDAVKRQACQTVPKAYRGDCLNPYAADTGVVISEFAANETVESVGTDTAADGSYAPLFTQVRQQLMRVLGYVMQLLARQADAATPAQTDDALFASVQQCLNGQGDSVECYAKLCGYEPGYLCAESILEAVTKEVTAGPEAGMRILADMVASELFDLSIGDSGHSLAHVVGRTTARYIGMDGEAFLRCPNSFDYGCVHGFLEIALTESDDPASAINEVCESLPEKPGIGRPNCYHGSGHGVMMNTSYNLDEALAICDGLSDAYGCWGGVFMENNSGYSRILEYYPENNSFDENNLLAPCDSIPEKYRESCYRVHILYLAPILQYDVDKVVATCLSAGEHTENCVFGFGWHILFEGFQNAFLPGTGMNFIEKTIHLCNQFPERYRGICYRPAINQTTVSYGAERTFEFCRKVEEQYVPDCYREIGKRLDDLVLHQNEKVKACASVPERYRDDCLHGREKQEEVRASSEGIFAVPDVKESGGSVAIEKNTLFIAKLVSFFRSIIDYIVSLFAGALNIDDAVVLDDYAMGVKKCFSQKKDRISCYAELCEYETGYLCAENIIASLMSFADASDGTKALHEITTSDRFAFDWSSTHLLSHIVGRSVAERLGITGDAFLTCPNDFDYGCQHGFVEYALSVIDSPVAVVERMCESMPDVPRVAKGNCYHGAGHALMMNYSYNLYESLDNCDKFNAKYDGYCETGVFMENVNGFLSGDLQTAFAENNTFLDDDPLAPCSIVADHHKQWCYTSHMPYIMHFYANDLEKIIASCDMVEPAYREGCVYSIGSYSRTLGSQRALLSESVFSSDGADNAIFICDHVVEEHRMTCYTAVLNQNLIDYGFEYVRSFCGKVDNARKGECWRVVGRQLGNISENDSEKEEHCSKAPKRYQSDCLGG